MMLHNTIKYPSLPLAHSVYLKEDYSCLKALLYTLKYDKYRWVFGDFKMVDSANATFRDSTKASI